MGEMPIIPGGFGDIQVAYLGNESGRNFKVAVKKLRPAGNEVQQMRVGIVRKRFTEPKKCLNCFLGLGPGVKRMGGSEPPQHRVPSGVPS